MNRIQRAARIARLNSATRNSVPFADSGLVVHDLIQKMSKDKAKKPVVFVDDSAQSMVCLNRRKFLFEANEVLEIETLGSIKELFETDLVSIKQIQPKVKKEPSLVHMRNLAISHVEDPVALSYIAHVAAIIDYRQKACFCSRCGTALQVPTSRACPKCGLEKYPRQSPVAIVLVHDPVADAVLLGRRPQSPVWSLLAGFCEPIESIENCAVREVLEESGVQIDRASVEIAATQPWPFIADKYEGCSFMMGCYAQVTESGQKPRPQVEELDEVRWFSSKELDELWRQNSPILPMKVSMARYLISSYLTALHAEQPEYSDL